MAMRTDEELADLAERVRKAAGFLPHQELDVGKLIGKFETASDLNTRIRFREVSPGFIRGALAYAEPAIRTVHYAAGLMGRMLAGDKQAAAVFLEEIAHILLGHRGKVMNHSIGVNLKAKSNYEVQDMEDEAEKFVWFFQAPISEVYSVQNTKVLTDTFGLTEEAAQKYCILLQETRDRIDGKTRKLPPKVIEFRARKSDGSHLLRAANQNFQNVATDQHLEKSLAQYAGFSHVPCKNCGKLEVRGDSGCKYCTSCGDEEGCS